ncbi:uncharacterized protein LOC117336868 [Pecten maximus]|uniref:uncharacterized protein LOC117336868 n=1 Tax=Pecten maximus TaxID=6579 RepID=UPI001457E6EA|nr:uncharacterized protein LOC117336868 [Pecten maximus]
MYTARTLRFILVVATVPSFLVIFGYPNEGWTLVMKYAHGQDMGGAKNLLDLWTGNHTVNEGDEEAMSIASDSKTYKSSIVDDWTNYSLSAVRVSFVTGGTEKAYVVFDALGSNKTNWFNKYRILYSSWNDLNSQSTTNYDSIYG